MSDEKKLNKLKREKAFWRKVLSVLFSKTGIIDREYVDKQLSEIEAKIKEEKMKCVFCQKDVMAVADRTGRCFTCTMVIGLRHLRIPND